MARVTNTRKNILEAAHRLIWENSYSTVSVNDICSMAGIRKGSFYHFFPSKEDLAVAAMEEHWQNMQPDLERVFCSGNDLKGIITEFSNKAYEGQKDKFQKIGKVCGCPYASLGAEISNNEENIRKHTMQKINEFIGYFEIALKNASEKGEIERNDVNEKAEEMYSFMIGVLVNARIQNNLEIIKNDLASGLLKISGIKH
jgi:TetR/AcrR family transcriptional repressor of nem operon